MSPTSLHVVSAIVLATSLVSCSATNRTVSDGNTALRANYIYNGDFSLPITKTSKMLLLCNGNDWSATDNNIVERDPVNGHDAPGCLRIKAITVGDVKKKHNRVIAPLTIDGHQATALGATKMRLSFWLRSNRPDGSPSQVFARCEAFVYRQGMVPNGFKTYPKWNTGPGPCDATWQECVIDDMPVTDTNVYNFHFVVNDTDSDILVDDIRFEITETR